MTEIIIAAVLGVVEGLTEFIPVSSTGHLILVGEAIGFEGPRAAAFDVFIQLGAILAVVVLYFRTFVSLFDFRKNPNQLRQFRGLRGITCLAVAVMPALIAGFFAHRYIKEYLFNSPSVAAALIVGGVVMIAVERWLKHPKIHVLDEIPLSACLVVGLFQCFSLWPGVSRSGSTIVGGMVVGLSRTAAAEFSFLVAVPVMFAATAYDLLKSLHFLQLSDVPLFAVGFLVSLISAVLAIRFFMNLLRRFTLVPFAVYRIVLGIIVFLAVGKL